MKKSCEKEEIENARRQTEARKSTWGQVVERDR